MDKHFSNIATVLSRAVKVVILALLVPLAIGLSTGILDQLEHVSLTGGTFREWIGSGVVTYVGIHLVLYRPVTLFQASHRMFSTLAAWLFGGQVSSVDQGGGGKTGKSSKGATGDPGAQGSTLVAFSPYVIPLYTMLVCALGWLLGRWVDRSFVDGPAAFFIGVTIAFQWLMTADDLQQQQERWHGETYLLAVTLVFILTLVIGGACLPWAVPEFSFVRALADGFSRAQAICATVVQQLFF